MQGAGVQFVVEELDPASLAKSKKRTNGRKSGGAPGVLTVASS